MFFNFFLFLFVSRNGEFGTLQKIACAFLAPEEQEKVITGPYSLASFVSCAKILNCSTWSCCVSLQHHLCIWGLCIFSYAGMVLSWVFSFMEREQGNESSRACKCWSRMVGNSTLWIFSVHVEVKKVKEGKKIIKVYMCQRKRLWTSLSLQDHLAQPRSMVGKYQRRLSVHQCNSSLPMFWWPGNLWGGAPCSRSHELLCCLRACLLQLSLLILVGRDILLGQCSSTGLWLSCLC